MNYELIVLDLPSEVAEDSTIWSGAIHNHTIQ